MLITNRICTVNDHRSDDGIPNRSAWSPDQWQTVEGKLVFPFLQEITNPRGQRIQNVVFLDHCSHMHLLNKNKIKLNLNK